MLKKTLKYISIAVILFLIIVSLCLKPIKVQGNSMYPGLKDGDWVLINKTAYILSKPQRRDTIVFITQDKNEKYIIKRIIGLEGESIEIKAGTIYINNDVLDESYIDCSTRDHFYKRVIPKNNFFVLGDNRKVSIDSRYREVGFVKKQHVIGKIIFKW